LVFVRLLSLGLILERHTNQFLAGGTHAAEVRIKSGPLKDRTGWVLEEDTALVTAQMKSEQAIKDAVPRRSPPGTLPRTRRR
jgi:hypothetical protein